MDKLNFVWDMKENALEKFFRKADDELAFPGDFWGFARVGNLCFDIVTFFDAEDRVHLGYDLYVGGVDTGYGYGKNEYPYDHDEGDTFVDIEEIRKMTFQEFKDYAEPVMEAFLYKRAPLYDKADLLEKAHKPLHIWW